MWKQLQSLFGAGKAKDEPARQQAENIVNACCDQPEVHIAYRGKADDRLYLAYNRTWQEVRFYQQNGLRVFCKACRRRVY